MQLSELPLELIQEALLPCLDLRSLLKLSATSHAFRSAILNAHGEWKARLTRDFGPELGARQEHFFYLYRRLFSSSALSWGSSDEGRLGLSREALNDSARLDRVPRGVATPSKMHIDAALVEIHAGGWCLVARDIQGRLWISGCLNGERGFAGPHESFTNPSRIQRTPILLPVSLPPIKSVSCGRAHIIALDRRHVVYELASFGQASRVHDRTGRWSSDGRIQSIVAGWTTSAVILQDQRVFVWWTEAAGGHVNDEEEERDETSGVHAVYDRFVDSVELPPLPVEAAETEELLKLAIGDTFAVALTDRGRIFKLSLQCSPEQMLPLDLRGNRERYDLALRSGRIAWMHLPLFEGRDGRTVSHIVANYRHFATIATSHASKDVQSTVSLGTSETVASSAPNRPASLQSAGVIDVRLGDHHCIALTADGRVLALGEASQGRLGHRAAPRQGSVQSAVECDIKGFAWSLTAAGWHSACLVLAAEEPLAAESDQEHILPGHYPRVERS